MVFLAWTEPPTRPDDPRRSGRVAPCAARYCHWPAPFAEHLQGLDQTLLKARSKAGLDSGPCLVAVGAGEPATLVEAAGKTLRQAEDKLAVVPSEGQSAFDPGLIEELVKRHAPLPVLVFASAVHADGAPADLTHLSRLCERLGVTAVVDATLAPWTTIRAFSEWTPHALIAALDRWHDEPMGCWGLALQAPLGTRTSLAKRTTLNAARLRTAMTGLEGVIVSPAPPFETGTISFRFEHWAPEEAVTMLREVFGVWVAGPAGTPALGVVPTTEPRWLRVSVAPATSEKDLSAAVAAISRVAGTPLSPLPAH